MCQGANSVLNIHKLSEWIKQAFSARQNFPEKGGP